MSAELDALKENFRQNLTNGSQTKAGVLQSVVDYFVLAFGEGIAKLIVIIMPFIALFAIIDILVEYLRSGKDRSVNTLLTTAVQTLLNYAIVFTLAQIWATYLYQELIKVITQKFPSFLLGLETPMTIDRIQTVFIAPFVVIFNVAKATSVTIVDKIRDGVPIEVIMEENKSSRLVEIYEKARAFVSTAFSTLSDAFLSFIDPDASSLLLCGGAILGILFIGFKIMKLIMQVLFGYLFAVLSIAVSLGMATFNFLFVSRTISPLSGGLDKITRIVVEAFGKIVVALLLIQVCLDAKIPLSPIWTATEIAKYQDIDHNFNNPDTFFHIVGYWVFMIFFTLIIREVQSEKTNIL
jgi:membrane protein